MPPTTRRGPLRPLSIAPMMAVTDRHYRALLRFITRRTLLYTEMVHTGAILRGDRERHLGFDDFEKPLALQLGGDDPAALAESARIAEERGYDEVDLNVGCPSARVQTGRFGVVLMRDPERVAEAVHAMRAVTSIPVTVKHRIGLDELDRYEDMKRFVDVVATSGCDRFIVHARKAWTKGLSPKENRTVPPLRYDDVHRLKRELPDLAIEINGGFRSLDQVEEQLQHVDGVMIGRAADDDPWMFAGADPRIFGEDAPCATPHEAVERWLPYVEARLAAGQPLHRMTRHALNLFAGRRGSRAWKRHLSEHAVKPGAGLDVVRDALARVPVAALAFVALLLGAAGTTGCTASTFDYTACTANAECRDAFGYGSVCTDGLCATATLDGACTLPDGLALPLPTGDTILLGTLFNRSTESHLARERSAALAVEQVNSEGGLAGVPFALASCSNEAGDDASDALALHLARDLGVPAIVGPSSSARTGSAYTAVEEHGTLVISPSATSPELTALDGLEHSDDDPGRLWRTAPPDTFQGPVIADALIGRGSTNVAAIHRADAYGQGLAEVVFEAFVGGGRNLELLPYDTGQGLVDQTVDAVSAGDVDEVLFISSSLDEVVTFLGAASVLTGYAGVDLMLTDTARNQDLLDEAADAIDDLGTIRGTSPALPTGPVYDAFQAAYTVAYGEDVTGRSYTAHAYDAAWLVAYGAAWADAQGDPRSGVAIARGLRRISDGAPVEIRAAGWDVVTSAFALGDGVDVEGASGELDYDDVTGETSGPIELWEIAADGESFVVTDEVRR